MTLSQEEVDQMIEPVPECEACGNTTRYDEDGEPYCPACAEAARIERQIAAAEDRWDDCDQWEPWV